MKQPTTPLSLPEFVTLLAMMISILAMSIDAILPAFDSISRDFQLTNPNDAQLVLSAMFFGFAVGQIAAGPLSDCYGRKPIIYIGYVIFIAGCLLSIFATDFTVLLIGRVLQGLGAAAPRIVSIALVRDGYEGRAMARIMSIVMAIFILVPAIAPAIGQGIIAITDWRNIFTLLLCMAVIAFVWFGVRQPETLAIEQRRKFSFANIAGGIVETLGYRSVAGYTIASGIIFGAFLGYLNSAQQVFQIVYKSGDWFAVYFGAAALAIGVASIFNSKVVIRLGMRFMTWRALIGLTTSSIIFCIIVLWTNGIPDFWIFMTWIMITFFCCGILFGNFNALAMEPIGHMAGLGAAVVGSLSTFISLPLGWAIGNYFDNTVTPLVFGFAILSFIALLVVKWAEPSSNEL